MKKNGLIWLGCSGSLTLALLTGNSAQANPVAPTEREFVFTAPQEDSVDASEFLDCGCGGAEAQAGESTDELGERAIALFGCDCAGCRNLAQNKVETGNVGR